MRQQTGTLTYGYDYLKNIPFYGLTSHKGYTTFWSLQKLYSYVVKHKITITKYVSRFEKDTFEVI